MVVRIERVYDVLLPDIVREMLPSVHLAISLGIEGIPLACIGANGYIARLLFWLTAPLLFTLLGVLLQAVQLCLQSRFAWAALLAAVPPVALRIIFVCYPAITNISFEAFACYTLDDGSEDSSRWLIADVSARPDSASLLDASPCASSRLLTGEHPMWHRQAQPGQGDCMGWDYCLPPRLLCALRLTTFRRP